MVVQVGSMHPLQIWMLPPGILKNIRHKLADLPAKKVPRLIASTCCLCFTALVGGNSF
jgi:hypothetical protein